MAASTLLDRVSYNDTFFAIGFLFVYSPADAGNLFPIFTQKTRSGKKFRLDWYKTAFYINYQ